MFLEYVIKYHLDDCLNVLSEQDIFGYYSIKIDFLKLFETYPDIGDNVLCKPVETLSLCDLDLVKAQQNILENDAYNARLKNLSQKSLKRNIRARFFGLPVCPELNRTIFPKNVDLDCFLKVTGTVVRITQAKMLEYHRKYVCLKCKYENYIEAVFEHRYVLKAPTKCGNIITCRCTTFSQINLVSREHCKDYQEIKIQEQVNKLSIGTIPGSMWVVLDDDLVDCCKPGDDVNICGTVRRRWRPSSYNKRSEVELVLQANYVEVCNSQRSEVVSAAPDVKNCFDEYWSKFEGCPLKGRDQILSTVCPQVYGMHLVKVALLLTIVTGSNHILQGEGDNKLKSEDRNKTNVRGQCHLLLVGDPGTGKSQLLRAAVDLTPRSVFTTGAGSTRAGLTCTALREEGEWQLEAGALVLADGGVCCVDEVGQLREHDRAGVHEAMEQQTISIAKAGIVCKLNTRCAIVAACNPKGHYDTDQPLSANVSLGTPLLSRFDLIFILLDSKNKEWDKQVSSYILFGQAHKECKKKWSIEKLQMYIALVGPRYTQMTRHANTILQTYYMMQRKSEHRDPSRTTVRMLDSLVRLSQAHCRLMYRTTILTMDAIVAVSLVDLSMQDYTLKDTIDALHSTSSKYPDFNYLLTAKRLLTHLNLHEIWKDELLFYGKLLKVDHKSLEIEIDKGSVRSFTKFDDVSDDNIQLSSTLVTSSYFNLNKLIRKDSDELDSVNKENVERDEGNIVNERLAATLKKRAALNKGEKHPNCSKIKHKGKPRKRKIVTLDTNVINKEIKKKCKKDKTKVQHKSREETTEEDLLKYVPSVNDYFNESNINLQLHNVNNHEENECNIDTEIKQENCEEESNQEHSSNKIELTVTSKNGLNNTKDKLNKFKFIGNHDLNKHYDERQKFNKNELVTDNKEESESKYVTTVPKSSSVCSSQISIFESSDCDIDLDTIL